MSYKEGRKEILRVLESVKEDGIAQTQIVRTTGLSKSTVSYLLKTMEVGGLIIRVRKGKDFIVWLQKYAPPKPTKVLRVGFIKAIEYSYLIPFSERLREMGYSLNLKVYEDGLSVVNNLLMGKLDMALAPVITQLFLAFSTKGGIRLVAAAGRGGSSLMGRKDRLDEAKSVGTTPLSTMELNLLSVVASEGTSPEMLKVVHVRSGQKLMELISSGQVDAVSIWEPYPTILEKEGFKKLANYFEIFGDFVCCALSCKSSCPEGILRAYIEAFEIFNKRKEEYAEMFSRRIGLPTEVAGAAVRDFEFRPELEKGDVRKALYRSGLWGLLPLVDEVIR